MTGGTTRLFALGVLGASAAVAAASLPDRTEDLRALHASIAGSTRAGPMAVDAHFLVGRDPGFVDFVRRTVPAHADVLTVSAPLTAAEGRDDPREATWCGHGRSTARSSAVIYEDFVWLTYQLAPRGQTCDATTRWRVYVGLPPGDLPPGSQVFSWEPDMAVARLP